MASPALISNLPNVRRVVTTHNAAGEAIVQSDASLDSQGMTIIPGVKSSSIWITTDSVPTNDNNTTEDGALREIDLTMGFGLVHPTGTNLRSTDLPPGAIIPMHRTSSLDYNILVSGELIHITEDGTEKHLTNPGDTVVQKGTLHSWRNPSKDIWARFISVLISAEPVNINGQPLKETFGQRKNDS